MRKIKNTVLAQLFMETSFVPKVQQLKQLTAAEELYKIVSPNQEYPFEFICFKITGYRPKSPSASQSITGKELIDDLPAYILKASARLSLAADKQSQKIYSITELAKQLNISTRTIERWQKKGLVGKVFVFSDGSKKTGFPDSALQEFIKANSALVQKASSFSIIASNLRNEIIKRAAQLAQDQTLSRTAVARKVASEFHRAVETIRGIIVDCERTQRKQIFTNPRQPISATQAAAIFNMYQTGSTVQQLAEKFRRSASSIYRIVTQKKIKKLLSVKIEYIPSDEFLQPDARQKILSSRAYPRRTPREILSDPQGKIDRQKWENFIEVVKKIPMLNRQQETELFKRYNFLKFLAAQTVGGLNLTNVSGKDANMAQELIDEANRLKNIIIEANLKLVVKIAGRHAAGANLQDLVSEGNLALMRAVEKFDYTKGFRFSTYASWVIARAFARHLPAEARSRLAETTEQTMAEVEQAAAQTSGMEEVETAGRSLMQVIEENLSEREQYVIRYHFGLSGTIVKKDFKTLKQIGEDLNLSKERIRQVELQALAKLRQTLSPEEFEQLTR